MKYALAGAALLFSSVLSTPAPLTHLFVRDPDTTNNIPDGNKNCNGNKYTPGDIKTAVNFAWQANKDGKKYKNNGSGSRAEYPHQNTPKDPLNWTNFNLAGCAQEGDDDAKKAKFQEFPIIPGGNAWQGGDVKQGNDRVVFQQIDDTTAAFCGIMTHTTNDKGRPTGRFRLCDDAEDAQAQPPYAQGTCSLHLTQWDFTEAAEANGQPRYDVEVHIFDNDKTEIGTLDRTGCDGKNPVTVSSALEDDLVVKAESQNDYVAFTLANQLWPSNGEFGNGDMHNQCSVGGWDGTDFPAYRQMDCSFPCAWGGGESSANLESDEG